MHYLAVALWTASAAVTDPVDVSARLTSAILADPSKFLAADRYGSALTFDALYEAQSLFGGDRRWPNNTLSQMNSLLDRYTSTPLTGAWAVLHHETLDDFGTAIGDTRGLFPVSYLHRSEYYSTHAAPAGYNASTDVEIAEVGGRRFILAWPWRLADDGTVARLFGGRAWLPALEATYVWGDDMFMGLTLVSRLASRFGTQEWVSALDWAASQQGLFRRHLEDGADGLYYHGARRVSGRGNETETSCCKWARANGWGLMAHVEALTAYARLRRVSDGQKEVLSAFVSHAEAVLKVQRADGRFNQVLNESSTFPETSATAMAAFAFAQGVLGGWLPSDPYRAAALRAWEGVAGEVALNGTVYGVCQPTGIQPTLADYESRGTDFEKSANGGVGAVLRAATAIAELTA